jgi:hypothetical protein
MMSTIKVVIHTSFQVGQVTFATSCRTSCIKVMGLNFAIKLLSMRVCDNTPLPALGFKPGWSADQT